MTLFALLSLFSTTMFAQTRLNTNIDKGVEQKTDTLLKGNALVEVGYNSSGQTVSAIWSLPSSTIVDEYKYEQRDMYTKRQIDSDNDGFVDLINYTIESFDRHSDLLLKRIEWFISPNNDTTFSERFHQRSVTTKIDGNLLSMFYKEKTVEKITSITYLDFLSVTTSKYFNSHEFIRTYYSEEVEGASYRSSIKERHLNIFHKLKYERIFEDTNGDTYFDKRTINQYLNLDSADSYLPSKSLLSHKYDSESLAKGECISITHTLPKRVYSHDIYDYIKNIHKQGREKIEDMIKRFF